MALIRKGIGLPFGEADCKGSGEGFFQGKGGVKGKD